MQTHFTPERLEDPDIAEANKILRACVHCGFCTATCPTYILLGDELDSPRGRIYLIKQMLEGAKAASAKVALHIDRCLSCLSCMTTCPSGVHYMHLVDHARQHIERTFKRPLGERLFRTALAYVLPSRIFPAVALLGRLAKPFSRLFPAFMRPALMLTPARVHAHRLPPKAHPAIGPRRMRVALLAGCVQQTLAPSINEATVRLLQRLGCEVVVVEGAGCCGALGHHMGRDVTASVRRNVEAWAGEADARGLDAIVANASGCGTTVKDYGFMLRNDPAIAEKAARVSALTKDVTEILEQLGLPGAHHPVRPRVAYHAACSLQHGQKITAVPRRLLEQAGFTVSEPGEAHLCCGSAGTYNLLQPELAAQLGQRKANALAGIQPDVIATGNIGCMTQLGAHTRTPVVHTVELLDWATGGPKPVALADI